LTGEVGDIGKSVRKSKDDNVIDEREKLGLNIRETFRKGSAVKSFVVGALDKTTKALESLKDTLTPKGDGIFLIDKKDRVQSHSADVTDKEETKVFEQSDEDDSMKKIIEIEKQEMKHSPGRDEDLYGDDSEISEGEKQRILANLSDDDDDEDEDDDDDEGDSEGSLSQGVLSNVKDDDNNSLFAEDIVNRSLISESAVTPTPAIDIQNYFKYVSDKFSM
jgi:hypothetical protein